MYHFGTLSGISGLFGLAMGILAQLHLLNIQIMAQPNSPDTLPNCTKKILSHHIKYVLFTLSHYSDHTDDI